MELKTSSGTAAGSRLVELLDDLTPLCEPMLMRMRIVCGPDRDMFCHRLRKLDDGAMEQVGVSPRYTAIALIGMAAAKGAETLREAPWQQTVEALSRYATGLGTELDLGDIGLLLWLDEYAGGLWTARLEETLTQRLPHAMRSADAMARAWLLSGVTANSHLPEAVRERLARTVLRALLECYNPSTGVFALDEYHPHAPWSSDRYRSVIGSFASQVYPLVALSMFLESHREPALLETVQKCAATVCSLQGGRGEWWWTFDARRRTVVMDYPVYSVHQDGMAPMALVAAASVTGRGEFLGAAVKGLQYLFDYREPRTGEGFIDSHEAMIWRAAIKDLPGEDPADLPFGLFAREMTWMRSQALPQFLRGGELIDTGDFRMLREARPYCPGWILYASALAARTGVSC